MKTKIYSVFPACGKTWLCEHQEELGLKILDSDSSQFSWLIKEIEYPTYGTIVNGEMKSLTCKQKVRHPNFPANYIQHIKQNIGKYDYIFVSSHASVREALDAEGIDFTIVYPSAACFAEWVGRCFIRDKRGETGCNPGVLYDNWTQWISECVATGRTHEEVILESCQHLSDFLV